MKAYPTLSTISRSQLMDDALNLARAGHLSYDTALRLTRQLAGEEEVVPLTAAKTAFKFLDRMLRQRDGYRYLQSYLLKLLENVYKKVKLLNIF
jgi:aminopeptidase N